jgi:hypothetical protein
MQRLARATLTAIAATVFASPAVACDGPAGAAVAISSNGSTYTVTNTAKVGLAVTFNAFGKTYSLNLGPGQSGTPSSGGLFNLPMHGYQSCTAVVVQAR